LESNWRWNAYRLMVLQEPFEFLARVPWLPDDYYLSPAEVVPGYARAWYFLPGAEVSDLGGVDIPKGANPHFPYDIEVEPD